MFPTELSTGLLFVVLVEPPLLFVSPVVLVVVLFVLPVSPVVVFVVLFVVVLVQQRLGSVDTEQLQNARLGIVWIDRKSVV